MSGGGDSAFVFQDLRTPWESEGSKCCDSDEHWRVKAGHKPSLGVGEKVGKASWRGHTLKMVEVTAK